MENSTLLPSRETPGEENSQAQSGSVSLPHPANRCSKCGFCLNACPVYQEYRTESASPRGKVQLSRHIHEGRIELSPHMQTILSRCLLCGSCSTACPSGVHGDRIFSGMRWQAARLHGIDWKKKALYQALSRGWIMHGSTRLAAWAQKWFGRWVENSIRNPAVRAKVPRFNARPFSSEAPSVMCARGRYRARVLYFHGCATNYLNGDVGYAVLNVLSAMGVEVHTPARQGCCGIPIFLSGARELSFASIRSVIEQFDDAEGNQVIVDCATCGSALRKEYVPLLKELRSEGYPVDSRLIKRAERLAANTRDVMEFIEEHADWLPPESAPGNRLKVTYHDPCHLVKGQGVGPALRGLFRRIPSIDYIEMKGADTCCGGGGTFQFDHPQIASAITAGKVASILETGAEAVVTGCPGCRMTLGSHLKTGGRTVTVMHPVQMFDGTANR